MGLFFGLTLLGGNVLAQDYRPPVPTPPAPQAAPSAATPNKKVQIAHPNAPERGILRVSAVQQESDGPWWHGRISVVIESTEMLLRADEIDYNTVTHDADARGHVHFEHFAEGEVMDCDHAEYNLDDETGKFYVVSGTSPARIQARPGLLTTSNPFYFQGKWAQRLSDRYILYQGVVTDCKLPSAWWVLRAPVFDIIPGDRAIAHHSVLRLKRFPILYTPIFYKSLERSPRKSGIVNPHLGNNSRRGKMIGIGYYWAINRSYDLLYDTEYFSQRGFAHDVSFRGKVNESTSFNFSLYGVNDRGIEVNNTLQKAPGYLFSVTGRSDLGHGWLAQGELNYLSSFLFRQTFSESFHEGIFAESHSVGVLSKHWSTFGLNVVGDRVENFQSTLPNDKIVIRKLPEFEFLSRERGMRLWNIPFWVAFDSSGGLVDRSQPQFQSRQFVPRTDFEPRVMTALRWKGIDLIPSFSLRETYYGSSVQNGAITGTDVLRSSREISVDLVFPSLARVFQAPKWAGVDKIKHVIEPRARYRYITGIDDFEKIIRFDQTDILANTNQVDLTLINRLYTKSKDGQVNEVVTWELSQSRYFDPTFGGAVVPGQRNVVQSSAELTGYAFLDGPRNYSPVVSALRVNYKVDLEWRADFDPLHGSLMDSGFTASMGFSNYYFSVGHNQVHSVPVLSPSYDQFVVSGRVGNDNRRGWNAGFQVFYDYNKDILQSANTQVTYNTDCCGFSVQFRRSAFGIRNDNQFRVAFALSNIGTFGTLKRQERIF